MKGKQSINIFITRLAQKIAILYPNNCADKEDYIQAGHLKLAEIRNGEYEQRDFLAYIIIAIARAMRETALEAIGAISAPKRVKKQIHKIELLLIAGKTEQEICNELKVDRAIVVNLRSFIKTQSWHTLFNEPMYDYEPFSFIDDLLSSCYLSEKDKIFIRAKLEDDMNSLKLTRKQKWLQAKNLRPKLAWSGYGI